MKGLETDEYAQRTYIYAHILHCYALRGGEGEGGGGEINNAISQTCKQLLS